MSTTVGEVEKATSAGNEKDVSGANREGTEANGGTETNHIADQEKIDMSSQNNANPSIKKDPSSRGGTVSPTYSNSSYPLGYASHLTPQQGYYLSYQSQVTPEPPSPAGPAGTTVYDVGSFFQHPASFHASPFTGTAQYTVNPTAQHQQPPLSPSQNNSVGGIPPASPLFPRVTGQATAGLLDQHRMLDPSLQQRGTPLSPAPPYLTPGLGASGAGTAAVYPNMSAYPAHNGAGTNSSNSPEDYQGWADNL